MQILEALCWLYDYDLDKVAQVRSQILGGLQQSAQLAAGDLNAADLNAGIYACAKTLMPFDTGNRFPMIPYVRLVLQGDRLLDHSAADDAANAPIDGWHLAHQRALSLVKGGIFAHVAGGFHRYTVDPTWTVPHFEKMLYDSGLMLEILAETLRFGVKSPAIERAMRLTVEWDKREMTGTGGYFYAART